MHAPYLQLETEVFVAHLIAYLCWILFMTNCFSSVSFQNLTDMRGEWDDLMKV